MKKPEQQWETGRFVALRLAEPPMERAGEPAVQGFELRARDGGRGCSACFSLTRQVVDAEAADEDLVFAARAWLAARGGRTLNLVDAEGRRIAGGAFTLAELSSPRGAPALRVVTLCPSNAEIVGALGAFERVVACEDSSDWPAEVATRERLGPDLGPDLDRVAAIGPDLAISSLSVPGMERVVTGLRVRGVPQRVLAPRSVDDVIADMRLVGADLGVSAEGVCAGMRQEREALAAARGERRRRVYLEWWPRPMFSPGAACYSNELIDLAGGINVFADRPGASVEVSAEEVVRAAPELCFVSWCGVAEAKLDPDNLIHRPGLEGLTAARAGRVYRLDERFSGAAGAEDVDGGAHHGAGDRRARLNLRRNFVSRIAVCQGCGMQVVSLEPQVARLVEELAQYRGYRTLWLDRRGYLCHSEPEDDYEDIGFAYVGTVFSPDGDELGKLLASFAARRAARVGAWPVAAALRISPVAALSPA